MTDFYIKYWLKNLHKYQIMDRLTLEEAQVLQMKLKRQGVKADIEKHKTEE